MNEWTIYLLTRLDIIQEVSIITLVMTVGVFFFHTLFGFIELDWGAKTFWYVCKRYLTIVAFCLGIITFLPTTKEAIVIYLVPKIANNQEIKEIPDLAVKAVKQWLAEKLEHIQRESFGQK